MSTRQLVKLARRQGWSDSTTGSGHVLLIGPHGHRVIVSSTTGDKRSWLNTRADLRRAGMAI